MQVSLLYATGFVFSEIKSPQSGYGKGLAEIMWLADVIHVRSVRLGGSRSHEQAR